jgi:four helix bundle protein
MRDFTNLKTWQRAHHLVLEIYKETRCFPPEERYGLTNQVRRSAASVPANIAEGAGRRTDADFARFVDYALGSANETQYHLLLARDLELIPSETHERLVGELREIRMMASALAQRLRKRQHSTLT